MRNLMKLLAVTAMLTLVCGVAAAKTLSFDSKDIPVKDTYYGMDRGLLDCSGQIELANGVTVYGDNTGAVNNVSLYSCSTWNESGGEVVYHVDFGVGDVEWFLDVTFDGCDLDIAVLDMCDEDLGCIGVANEDVNSVGEGWNGEVWFVIDGYNGAACAFDLTLTWNPYLPPEPVSFCDVVQPIEDGGAGMYFGDTCDGENLIASMDCSTYTENGFEHFYGVFMPAGSSFQVDLVHAIDSALWVLDSCVEPFTCLAYADDFYPDTNETIVYSNTTGMDITVFLVVDSWTTDSCGMYEFLFTPTGGAIANRVMDFGDVKSLYK